MKHWLRICLISVFAGALCQAVHAAERDKDIDWNVLGNDAVNVLSQYLQVDTSNPPGNEIKGASFLKALFDREGIENQVFESEPGRASIYARLKGGIRNGFRPGTVAHLGYRDRRAAAEQMMSPDDYAGFTISLKGSACLCSSLVLEGR